MKLTFSSVNLFDFNAKKQARKTAGKTWLKDHSDYLAKYKDRAATANMDSERLVLIEEVILL